MSATIDIPINLTLRITHPTLRIPTTNIKLNSLLLSPSTAAPQWGFTNPARGVQQPLINARSETLLDLPTFRRLLHHPSGSRRCAVPATAFFEWHRSPPPGRQTLTPYLVRHPDANAEALDTGTLNDGGDGDDSSISQNVSYLAALYDDCPDPQLVSHSFVVITTASAPDFSWLHSRQPVFLSSEQQLRAWLLIDSVPPANAVAALDTQTGLKCTKMLRDLSAPAPNQREFRQKGISSFFSKSSPSKSTPAKTKAGAKDEVTVSESAALKTRVPQTHPQTDSNDHFDDIPSAPHSPSSDRRDGLDGVDNVTAEPVIDSYRSKFLKNDTRPDPRHMHVSPLKPKSTIRKTKSSPSQSKQKKGAQTSIRNFFHSNN